MWRLLLCALLASGPVSPNIISEMGKGVVETAKFVSNPVDQVGKIKGTAEYFSHFQDKSQLPQKNFTLAEVAQCDGEDGRDFFIIIKDGVYDLKEFAQYHPAGYEPLKRHAGQDATAAIKASGMPPQSYEPFLKYLKVGNIVKAEENQSSALDSVVHSVKSHVE
ncbi:uncharacterized protein LOC126375584 [Pectinophora gossypiella]|uniref:uncharacterized protein LOC126375584 n=1 Tax=Pectinophora gossypiella TaxID=13191 RepID=UPI00214F11C7|nr:uncharacterized protein LOC126375584 [Pectinophora gossypiella]